MMIRKGNQFHKEKRKFDIERDCVIAADKKDIWQKIVHGTRP